MHPRRGKIDPQRLAAWKAEHARLRDARIEAPLGQVRWVAGADCAFFGEDILAAAVLWDAAEQAIVAESAVRLAVDVPYIPGYLSFREAPAVLAALHKLPRFEAVLCDGAGFAHPRRCGLAVAVGVTLDCPCVGVAKSRLLGDHDTPGQHVGDATPLTDKGKRIGTVLRTRPNVTPLFISVGHRVDLASACDLVLRCRTRYRLPEPTRHADRCVTEFKSAQL